MEVAEIKISYSNTNTEKIKISNSLIMFEVFISNWDLNIVEYQEEVKVVFLNRANIVLGIYALSKGGISGTVIDIRIILGIALKSNASYIILAHNHPSGNLNPSESDKTITQKLKRACEIVEIPLLDHLIITKEGYFSFSDDGLL
jgi:DNA repair protein RadC